jgi:hypothetical protein
MRLTYHFYTTVEASDLDNRFTLCSEWLGVFSWPVYVRRKDGIYLDSLKFGSEICVIILLSLQHFALASTLL